MRRRAFTLVELIVVLALAALILGVAIRATLFAGRTQEGTGAHADQLEEAARAHVYLARDLACFHPDGTRPVPALAGGEGKDASAEFEVSRVDGGAGRVRWSFAAKGGRLTRREAGRPEMTFELGDGGRFEAAFVDPSFAFREGGVLGEYGNRVVYIITVRRPGVPERPPLCLVAACPLIRKAVRDTFPFWPEVAP